VPVPLWYRALTAAWLPERLRNEFALSYGTREEQALATPPARLRQNLPAHACAITICGAISGGKSPASRTPLGPAAPREQPLLDGRAPHDVCETAALEARHSALRRPIQVRLKRGQRGGKNLAAPRERILPPVDRPHGGRCLNTMAGAPTLESSEDGKGQIPVPRYRVSSSSTAPFGPPAVEPRHSTKECSLPISSSYSSVF
jgi:hypothetical protein